MDRARRLPRTALKVQRRLWLIQALFWPTVAVSVVGLAALVVVRRGRRQPPPTYRPRPLASEPATAAAPQPEHNGRL